MKMCNDMSLHLPVIRLKFLFARKTHIIYSRRVEGIVNPSIMYAERFLFLDVSRHEDIQK